MNRHQSIKSSADLKALITEDSLSELQMTGGNLSIEFDPYYMQEKDLKHLIKLTNFVTDLSMDRMTVASQTLKAEISAAITQFSKLRSLTLWWDDVFHLARLISPIQFQPASKLLTSICFSSVVISTKRASKISKALEYNKTLKNFEAHNGRKGESNLVPILRGNHTLKELSLDLYYLTSTEFFALCRFFVGCTTIENLKRLGICVCPEYNKSDKAYLKFATLVAENNVARCLFLNMGGCNLGSQHIKYAERVGGFKL